MLIKTQDVARQVIEQTEGRVFGAHVAAKRTDGEPRTFLAKTCETSFDEKDVANDQVTVIDVNRTRALRRRIAAEGGDPEGKVAYRTIALERVDELQADGKRYRLSHL